MGRNTLRKKKKEKVKLLYKAKKKAFIDWKTHRGRARPIFFKRLNVFLLVNLSKEYIYLLCIYLTEERSLGLRNNQLNLDGEVSNEIKG